MTPSFSIIYLSKKKKFATTLDVQISKKECERQFSFDAFILHITLLSGEAMNFF